MKETVAMLNQQYVMPNGLTPYAGVTAKSPWLASESEKRQRKTAIRWKRRFVVPACKTA